MRLDTSPTAVARPVASAPASTKLGRNAPCHCGSRRKYKRCCMVHDEAKARALRGAVLPPWILNSDGKYQRFMEYACNVYELPSRLRQLTDRRLEPKYATFDVVNSLVQAALLRLPSINAIEGDLTEADFQQIIGHKPKQAAKSFSAEVIYNTLDKLHVSGVREGIEDVLWTAERNKAFRDDSYSTLRVVALDGWEPFCSYERHGDCCLERLVKWTNPDTGEVEKRVQYYHRYVVALLVAPLLDVVLDIEPVRSGEARRQDGEDEHHEGELTAGLRLMDRLHATYGSFIDAFVLDALYANGPVMTKLDGYSYGAFIVLKKDDNEPLKEALALWQGQEPCDRHYDEDAKEHIDFWDVDDIETLDTFKGKARVVRAVVTKDSGKVRTWCFALVGERVRKVGLRAALKTVRSRWHIENTAFNQWVKYWNLSHVYHHTQNAILAILLLWAFVFNLLQLFVYRRLKRLRDPKDPIDTIRHIVEVMSRQISTIDAPVPWRALADTG